MESLLPVGHGPILAMSGGAMESLLPAAPPVPVVAMSGGSKAPIPQASRVAMSGGGASAASFGITDAFPEDQEEVRALQTDCAPITETVTKLCEPLSPFVDRRVQALLKRVSLPPGSASVNMGCGTITRNGTELKISFHHKAITLLSGDITGTFAAFREGLSPHVPRSIEKSSGNLLSWMLGSDVTDKGAFDLVAFVKDMTQPLPLEGFRRFLSYHRDHVEEIDVLKYAMELYGYTTGPLDHEHTDRIYGWIFPRIAVRRVEKGFAVYSEGDVKTVPTWSKAWPSDQKGMTVYEPAAPVAAPTETSMGAPMAAPEKPVATMGASATAPEKPIAAPEMPIVPEKPMSSFSGKKNTTPVAVPDQQMISGTPYTLRGVIHHEGDTAGGHYTYLYHSPTNKGTWVEFSDSSITYPSPDQRKQKIDTGYVYLLEKQESVDGHHKGIQNVGNSCWMNAALQMFYHIPEYRAHVEKFKATDSKEITDLTLALQRIFLTYSAEGNKAVECVTEYHILFKHTFPDQPIGSQQDAMEFITKVLLHIVEHVPELHALFAIDYQSMLTCANSAVSPSTKTDPMNVLSLAIPDSLPQSLTLNNLLEQEAAPQVMGAGTKVGDAPCEEVTKTVSIQIPDANRYVILQLKRFDA